jgi:hypothetical protein
MHPEEACHDNYDNDHANDVEDAHRFIFLNDVTDRKSASMFRFHSTNAGIHNNRRRQTVEEQQR